MIGSYGAKARGNNTERWGTDARERTRKAHGFTAAVKPYAFGNGYAFTTIPRFRTAALLLRAQLHAELASRGVAQFDAPALAVIAGHLHEVRGHRVHGHDPQRARG